jgi:tRNA(fMet)-specific endonuclease VapC
MVRPRCLLDTNMCIYLIRQRSQRALRRFEEFEVGEIGVSVITVSELSYGVEKSKRPEQNRQALERFLLPLEVVSFGLEATRNYGRIRAALEKQGTPIGPLDTLIAAHAASLGITLVTNNTREFERVPGLLIEDWTQVEGETR